MAGDEGSTSATPADQVKGGIVRTQPLPLSREFPQRETQDSTQQTIQGENLEERLEESDTSAPSKGKEREGERRFTIVPGEFQDEFMLLELVGVGAEEQEVILEKIQSSEAFMQSFEERPTDWCNAIRAMIEDVLTFQGQTTDLTEKTYNLQSRVRTLTQRLKESTDAFKMSQKDAKCLGKIRDGYRNESDGPAEEIEALEEQEDLRPTEA